MLFCLCLFSLGVLLDANECSYGSCIPLEGDMHRYPSPYNFDLKEKIAKYRGVRKEQIFLGVGSDEAIDMVVRVFCIPGEGSLLTTPPTYGMYKVRWLLWWISFKKVNISSKNKERIIILSDIYALVACLASLLKQWTFHTCARPNEPDMPP